MTRRDWWLGIAVIALVILIHALVPRYRVTALDRGVIFRIDRWTGAVETVNFDEIEGAPWIKIYRLPPVPDEHTSPR